VSEALRERGFAVRRTGDTTSVSTPQPVAERVAVGGAVIYALAIAVEAARSAAWLVAGLFAVITVAAVWVAAGRVRYRLGRAELEVTGQFPARLAPLRLPTHDVVDFVAQAGAVSALLRGGGTVALPRGTMRSDDEARALAEFLRDRLEDLREHEAGYRSF
jgi:hypothetical protein